MSNENIKTLYTFSVNTEKEVDEVTTRADGDKTITETVKVKKIIPTFFAIKRPSRSERENAEEERASWWSRYVEKGIFPEALLIKIYNNNGGTLSDEQKRQYLEARAKLFAKMEEYELVKITDKSNKELHTSIRLELVSLRDAIIKFEQEQASFFENTAESKARMKLAEWLLLNLSYYRTTEDSPWVQYFSGNTNDKKLQDLENKEENNDELFSLARTQLYFVVSFLISSNFTATKSDIDEFLEEAAS